MQIDRPAIHQALSLVPAQMPLSLPNITCPLTRFLNKILRLRAGMEQIGRTSESEDFTSIFAQKVAMGHHLFVQAPTRFHAPTVDEHARSPRGQWRRGRLAAWAREAKSPLPSFGFSKNLASRAGFTRLNIRKGLVRRHTRDPRKDNLSLESFQAVSIRAGNEAILSVRPTSSLYAQRTP